MGIDDVDKVSGSDLGREISFRIRSKNKQLRQYTGEIIRLFYKDDKLHLALRFWKQPIDIT